MFSSIFRSTPKQDSYRLVESPIVVSWALVVAVVHVDFCFGWLFSF